MVLGSVLDACEVVTRECYALRESFLQILALLSALWGVGIVGLIAATDHPKRLWFALITAVPLPLIWWLLSVSTPDGEIHVAGTILGWGWAGGTARLAWTLSKGPRTASLVRATAMGATAVALASPLMTPALEALARERMLLPTTSLGSRADGTTGPAIPSPSPSP